jgi:hypothetical protein
MINMKALMHTFACIAGALLVFSCAGTPESITTAPNGSGGKSLDTAIEEAAARIDAAFAAGTEIALISVSSPSTQFSEYVLSYLETVLVNNGKLAVVDRTNLDKIRAEQGFQSAGDVSDESAMAIGQMLGAGAIVTGSLVNLGDAQRLNIKSINVETAKITASYAGDIANSARVQTLLAAGTGAVTGGGTVPATSGAKPATPAQAAAPAQVAAPAVPAAPSGPVSYNVGDKGPAGGLIFYSTDTTRAETAPPPLNREYAAGDTGPASGVVFYPVALVKTMIPPVTQKYEVGDTGPAGGIIFYVNPQVGAWKYLEAAPANTEKVSFWCSEGFPVTAILNVRAVGSGKPNSDFIMRAAVDRGGGFDWAAEICDSLVVNGYDDWFLPSRDELHMMYGNLQRKGLGNFKGEWYWSSTPSEQNSWLNIWTENFADGQQGQSFNNAYGKARVRAIRQF